MKAFERDGKMVKTCTKCGETKDVSEYGLHRCEPDGLKGQCKACVNAYAANRYVPRRRKNKAFEIDGQMVKTCCGCGETKMLDQYHYHAGRAHKTVSRCKICTRDMRATKLGREVTIQPRAYVFEQDGKQVKQCLRCSEVKEVSEFPKRKTVVHSGLGAECHACKSERHRRYHASPKGIAVRKAREARDGERIKRKKKECEAKWREKHKHDEKWVERQREIKRNHYQRRRGEILARHSHRYATEPGYRMLIVQRNAMRDLLRGEVKGGRTVELLGCSVERFMTHLESLFKPGMTWKNYGEGKDRWQIDHILPGEVFDLSLPSHQRACFVYTNLQPLWMPDNLLKSDWLDNGRQARTMTTDEKREYLVSKGYVHLFEVTASTPPSHQACHSPAESAPSSRPEDQSS